MADVSKVSSSGPGAKDSVTEVAEESFVRERAPDIERGTVLANRYQIEGIIGKGGSGIVLRAFDRTAQAVVALKVLKSELASDAKWAKRFSRELRLGRPVQHPNVCRIFDIGEADGHRFLTMELARGGTLRDQLKRGESAARPLPERLADAEAVIAGLAAIHAVGIVHRDFKPDNLLRMEDGRLVLSDFGLATDAANAPGATVLIGTPHYMAPEVLAGEPATTRSDVWALGVVLHEIFFGRRPERRATSFDGSNKPSPRAESPTERAMLALCEHCLAEVPLDRPADAGAVVRLFDAARSSPGNFRRRHSSRYLVGASVGLATLALAGGLALKSRRKSRMAPVASAHSDVIRLEPTGEAADWSKIATAVTEVPGRVHCFSMVDDKTARLVWGAPRRAEDVDIASGKRRQAELAPETYRVGCPELSPQKNALLFMAQNAAGAMEIRLSNTKDGHRATTVTPGSDPLWLRNGEEFIYNIDAAHAAVFSLPTMSLTLLPDPHLGGHQNIVEKAVHPTADTVALLLFVDNSEMAVAFYEGRTFDYRKTFVVPAGLRIQFDDRSDDLLISYQLSGPVSTLAALDWRDGIFRNLGRYSGLALVGARAQEDRTIVLGRAVSRDAWFNDGSGWHPLTSDGENYSAAISLTGDLLLSKRSDDGRFSIWSQGRNGALKKLTAGPTDVEPEFSKDGRSWVYADYAQKSIMLCSTASVTCRTLRRDEMWPAAPRFSPDGQRVAYLTQGGATRLTVVSVDDGQVQQSWDAYPQCSPVWSSSTTIWSFEALAGHYFWAERNTTTGERTGHRLEISNSALALSEIQCWPAQSAPDSPFFQRVRVQTKETDRLLRLSASSSKR
jgi:serine/threonine protein kinase